MQCASCFCSVRAHTVRCFQCVKKPLPPNAIDMADHVDVCIGCEETLCPFHTPERALRRGLCARCDERHVFESQSSDEEEAGVEWGADDDSELEIRNDSDSEEGVQDEPEWWSEDEVIVPSACKKAKRCSTADMVSLLRPLEADAEQVCAICLDGLPTAVTLPCSTKHAFHAQCITTWLGGERSSCPVCNTTFA